MAPEKHCRGVYYIGMPLCSAIFCTLEDWQPLQRKKKIVTNSASPKCASNAATKLEHKIQDKGSETVRRSLASQNEAHNH